MASIDLNKPNGEDLQKSDTKTLKKIDEILEDSDMVKDKEDDQIRLEDEGNIVTYDVDQVINGLL